MEENDVQGIDVGDRDQVRTVSPYGVGDAESDDEEEEEEVDEGEGSDALDTGDGRRSMCVIKLMAG